MKNGRLLKHQLFVLVPTPVTAASLCPARAGDPALLQQCDLDSIVFHAPSTKSPAQLELQKSDY